MLPLFCLTASLLTTAPLAGHDSVQFQAIGSPPSVIVGGPHERGIAASLHRIIDRLVSGRSNTAFGSPATQPGPRGRPSTSGAPRDTHRVNAKDADALLPMIHRESNAHEGTWVCIQLESFDDVVSYQHGLNTPGHWSLVFRGKAAAALLELMQPSLDVTQSMASVSDGGVSLACFVTGDHLPGCMLQATPPLQ